MIVLLLEITWLPGEVRNKFNLKIKCKIKVSNNGSRICELLWLKKIIEDVRIEWENPLRLYYDNKLVISIAYNLV